MQYLATVLPRNGAGIVALSWNDFYPDEALNSILGEGSVHCGCAAISFGHYGLYTPPSENHSVASNRGWPNMVFKWIFSYSIFMELDLGRSIYIVV